MARRKGRTHFSRKKGSGIWTADVLIQIDPLATVTTFVLCDKTDFLPASQVTMVMMRGWLHIQPVTGSILDDVVALAMFVADEDLGLTNAQFDPLVAQNYLDEDCVWTTGASTTHGVGTVIGGGGAWIDVDVKTDRIIREGQRLQLSMTNVTGTGEQTVSGVLRGYYRTN